MNEFRTLKVFLVPLILVLVFFIMTPRMCARRLQRAQQQAAPQVPADTGGGGLQITSQPAGEAPRAAAGSFPEGLDAARVQYLVEIDEHFAAPKTVTFLKKARETDPMTKALLKLQYIEKQGDGYALTREGRLKLQFTETADAYIIQVAKRVFDRVNFMERVEDDKYRATIQWKWQANEVGEELHALTMEAPPSWMSKAAQADIRAWQPHTATAEFHGTAGHWALSSWVQAPDDELR